MVKVYYRNYAIDIKTIVSSLKDLDTIKYHDDSNTKLIITTAFINMTRKLNTLNLRDIRIIFVHQVYCVDFHANGLQDYSYLSRHETLKCCPSTYLYTCPIILRYDYSVMDKGCDKPCDVTVKIIKHRDIAFDMEYNIQILKTK